MHVAHPVLIWVIAIEPAFCMLAHGPAARVLIERWRQTLSVSVGPHDRGQRQRITHRCSCILHEFGMRFQQVFRMLPSLLCLDAGH